jgi:D-serine deaminase-like pyridoxal phosphate-dependent protein
MPEIADLETPCVVIDLGKVAASLQRAQADAETVPVAARGRVD